MDCWQDGVSGVFSRSCCHLAENRFKGARMLAADLDFDSEAQADMDASRMPRTSGGFAVTAANCTTHETGYQAGRGRLHLIPPVCSDSTTAQMTSPKAATQALAAVEKPRCRATATAQSRATATVSIRDLLQRSGQSCRLLLNGEARVRRVLWRQRPS
ncbi:hypothetical protein M011DRAFT_314616 [Sporormia fimetaria CBS 119925]|uniref:Uncharacterized protein n=1 Tax=Sporormia fimetaria CBS 119925 TaxID=1340428 RepID=A0A6A6UVK4_9PLEO|nr:hypothetical protein M011DRAFT_314616 [Sporormia fimetaria CBS 119925]